MPVTNGNTLNTDTILEEGESPEQSKATLAVNDSQEQINADGDVDSKFINMREVSILDLDKEGSINLDADSDDNTISGNIPHATL